MSRRVMIYRSRGRFLLAALAATMVILGILSCGVRTESQPHELKNSPLPTVAAPKGGITQLTDVYLVRNYALVAVERAVPIPVTLEQTMKALLSGPTPGEARRGLRSSLPGVVLLHKVSQQDSIVTVDLSPGLGTVDSQEQGLALAQVTYTMTARPGVQQLRVLVDGKAVEVPRADGTSTKGAVGRSDYRSLLAR